MAARRSPDKARRASPRKRPPKIDEPSADSVPQPTELEQAPPIVQPSCRDDPGVVCPKCGRRGKRGHRTWSTRHRGPTTIRVVKCTVPGCGHRFRLREVIESNSA